MILFLRVISWVLIISSNIFDLSPEIQLYQWHQPNFPPFLLHSFFITYFRVHFGALKSDAYLKELADIYGIKTQITFHIARHTFASMVTMENGVPIDSVSKILGHRSITTIQIYAKVSDLKISQDTKVLFRKFRKWLMIPKIWLKVCMA